MRSSGVAAALHVQRHNGQNAPALSEHGPVRLVGIAWLRET
jgi:hypothetical protein